MCRSIHTLYKTDPPVSREDITRAALQYVRKVSGYHQPPKVNEAAFMSAVDEVTASTIKLLTMLENNALSKQNKVLVDIRNE